MKLNIYSILDSKSGVYSQPFFKLNTSMAVRAFGDLANDELSSVAAHPEDYTLYHIGEYDDGVASLKGITPQPIGNGASYLRFKNQPELPKRLQEEVVMTPKHAPTSIKQIEKVFEASK